MASKPRLRVVSIERSKRGVTKRTRQVETKQETNDDLPTTWRTYDRKTDGFKKVLIVDMDDSHLLAAIAYCERKAVDYQHMTNLPPIETARRLWPGYVALVAEAARRFGPASARPVLSGSARAIILPDTEKEDA
jgi:hypothetical protein